MTSVTREQLVLVLDEKLDLFKQTIDQLRESVEEANKFMQFASKQYDDMVKKVCSKLLVIFLKYLYSLLVYRCVCVFSV